MSPDPGPSSNQPELLATCWTHGNSYPLPGHDVSPLSLIDRAEAASEAGYVGLGIWDLDLQVSLQDGHTLDDLSRIFTDLGLKYVELEFLTDWWAQGAVRTDADAMRRRLLHAAEVLGARHIKVGAHVSKEEGVDPPPLDIDQLAPELANLGADAAEHGTRIALEFLPVSDVANARDAVRLLEAADHPALGLVVDIWHAERGTTTLADIAAIPSGRIFCAEINDAPPPQGGAYADTIHNRVMPGHGEFDITGFVDAVRASGFDGPWGIEILSAEERKRPILDVLREARLTSLPYLTP